MLGPTPTPGAVRTGDAGPVQTRPHEVAPSGLDDALCPDCGYSLRALTSPRCPECGLDLAPLRAPESRIPWVQRRQRGRFRAYWQTVYFVMFGHRLFRAEMVRPVSLGDAQRFRWVTVGSAWVTLVACIPLWYALHPRSFNALDPLALRFVFAAAACAGLWLAALTGVHTYFFHPRWMPVMLQNRAVALSYYMCAPLALLPPLVLLAAAATAVLLRYRFDMPELLITFGPSLALAVLVPWWLDIIRLARQVLRRRVRMTTIAVAVPLISVLLTALLLGVVPLTLLYAAYLLPFAF